MTSVWEITQRAIAGDQQAFIELLEMVRNGVEGAEGQMIYTLKVLCESFITGKTKDDLPVGEIIDEIIKRLRRAAIKPDLNVFGLVNRICSNAVNDYFTSTRRATEYEDAGQIDTTADSQLGEELFYEIDSNPLVKKNLLNYGAKHPLKRMLYMTEKGNLHISSELIKDGEMKTPLYEGFFKNVRYTTFHPLKYRLWRTYNKNERPYMIAAVEAMMLSKSENRPGNPDPMVGACVANPKGEIVAICARGERRPEEHCEYILFDEKLKGVNLGDCTLYVTLEPCSKRGYTKTGIKKFPCAEHIINSGIKKVCVGMLDPDENIFENGVQKLLEAGIDVWYFHPDLTKQISEVEGNQTFIKHRLQQQRD